MPSELPAIAGSTGRSSFRVDLRQRIGGRVFPRPFEGFNRKVDCSRVEARQGRIEIDISEVLELRGEDFNVPSAVFGDLVVSDASARFCGSLRSASSMVGTVASPSNSAAC